VSGPHALHAIELDAGEIARATGGRVAAGDPARRFSSLAIDSRRVPPGSLFVALPGARADGHDFIPQALAAGAAGVLVSKPGPWPGAEVVVEVPDTLAAVQACAAAWRARLRGTVVGIAGSNGKTTTKEVTASVLAARGRTRATPGNENSQIGTPMTILATPLGVEFLVLEMGTSLPGELGRLASFARPDVAIVTAAFAEHLEFLDSVDGVVAAETEILEHLSPGALALVGSAEPKLVAAARRRTDLALETLGRRPDDDWKLGRVVLDRAGTRFELSGPRSAAAEWRVPLLGEPAAWAASFAIAAATRLGLSPAEIRSGLEGARPAAHRMCPVRHGSKPIFVLDDCYNANPASSRAALEAIVALREPGSRLVAVLGDMLELGAASDEAHRELGEDVARIAPDAHLVAVGRETRLTVETARARGVVADHVPDAAVAIRRVSGLVADGSSTVLVKGSRGIALERVVDALLA
jgi:UDP-N-acetylmuramoyl-tripeptide--D-alanyl-D-alanine ligase